MQSNTQKPSIMLGIVGAILALSPIVIAAGLLVYSTAAWPHSSHTGMKFDFWCCSGNSETGDCQPIPAASYEIGMASVHVELNPGDHLKVTSPQTYDFDLAKVRWTTDGMAYACLHPHQSIMRCLYLPPPGF